MHLSFQSKQSIPFQRTAGRVTIRRNVLIKLTDAGNRTLFEKAESVNVAEQLKSKQKTLI